MKRPWQTWTLFFLCLALVLPAMGWLTVKALELDRQTQVARRKENDARRQAVQQEIVSSALWRMDWVLTPIVAQEAARPYYVYNSFYESPGKGKVQQLPSPLLVQPSEYVLLHFQLTPADDWTSPQNPTGVMCDVAIQNGAPLGNIKSSGSRLARLKEQIQYEQLFAMLPDQMLPAVQYSSAPWAINNTWNFDGNRLLAQNAGVTKDLGIAQIKQQQESQEVSVRDLQSDLQAPQQQAAGPEPQRANNGNAQPRAQRPANANAPNQSASEQSDLFERQQYARGGYNFRDRNRAFESSALNQMHQQRMNTGATTLIAEEGVSRPVWLGEHLLLARRVKLNERVLVQGCWLDWPKIKSMLLKEIVESLPDSDLVPVTPESAVQPGRMLATLPVQLVVPRPTAETLALDLDLAKTSSSLSSLSPIQLSLVIAWGCLILATGAVAIVLRGVVTLSERRGAFVSAVTHELRTPLTTFRMYAEMLAEGMVPDVDQRQKYMETLRVEADRLSHLVENVLSYARLERGKPGRRREQVAIESLIDKTQSRLADRATEAEMKLVVEADDSVRSTTLQTDPSAVEQVLFNLVDNACKYAAAAEDRRIHLQIQSTPKSMQFIVRDHGPGISKHEGRQMFRPFSKSVEQAATSAPGVGLGLALCRRLANSLGGRLELDSSDEGAAFVLTLPKD